MPKRCLLGVLNIRNNSMFALCFIVWLVWDLTLSHTQKGTAQWFFPLMSFSRFSIALLCKVYVCYILYRSLHLYRLDCHLLVYLDNMNTLKFSYNLKGKCQYPCSKPNNLGLLEARFRPASLLAKQLEKKTSIFFHLFVAHF